MKTQDIINEINAHFAATYKNAGPFVGSGDLWDFCIETIRNPVTMSSVAFANDLGIPPVRSLLVLYRRNRKPDADFRFKSSESQSMGALMGYVFKYVLGYRDQKERCVVKDLGVKTATRYLDGPVIEFEA